MKKKCWRFRNLKIGKQKKILWFSVPLGFIFFGMFGFISLSGCHSEFNPVNWVEKRAGFVESPIKSTKGYIFRYASLSARSVFVAGQFNGFTNNPNDRKVLKMVKSDGGLWEITIPFREYVRDPKFDAIDDDVFLEHGRDYTYKLVINENNFVQDPNNDLQRPDGFGGFNSIVIVQ